MIDLQSRKVSGDVAYFQRLVAKAILWKRAERIVSAQAFGGYRANIVAYSIAKLSNATQQRLNLDQIWQAQALEESIEDALAELAHLAFRLLTGSDRPTANVTEWAKREQCWKQMRSTSWSVSPSVGDLLVPVGRDAWPRGASANLGGERDGGPDPSIDGISSVPGDAFLAISSWAKETNNLTPWERRFSYTIGVRLNREGSLTSKQVPHAERILANAQELGFDPLAE